MHFGTGSTRMNVVPGHAATSDVPSVFVSTASHSGSGDADDGLAAAADVIHAHRNFPHAVRHYLSMLVAWRSQSRMADKHASTHTRSSITSYVVYLHFRADPADPDDGASYLKLLDLCTIRGDCGPRGLTTTLALLRLAGYVQRQRGTMDRRVRLYRPTEKLLSHVRQWYANTLGCLDRLTGTTNFAGDVARDPDFLRHVVTSIAGPYFARAIQLVGHYPALLTLFEIEGGSMVAAMLVTAALDDTAVPRPAEMAKRLSCSVSQVRNVMAHLEARELLRLDADRRVPDDAPLVPMLRRYIARELAFYQIYAFPGLFSPPLPP
jgi:hypothetical protein